MQTYKGHIYTGPVHTLDQLRAAVAQLDHLPGDMPVRRIVDDANTPDSYDLVHELEVTPWDGEVQVPDGTENASSAIFI